MRVKLKNLKKEYEELIKVTSSVMSTKDALYKALYDVNSELWEIEDHIRDLERNKDFGRLILYQLHALSILKTTEDLN